MSKSTRGTERVAVDVLKCALSWEPDVCLIGNNTAKEIAMLAASVITACPKCGAEAWVNIDCEMCLVASALMRGEP